MSFQVKLTAHLLIITVQQNEGTAHSGGPDQTGGLYKSFRYDRILNRIEPENLAVAICYIFNALLFF